jgi:hypothetical protein
MSRLPRLPHCVRWQLPQRAADATVIYTLFGDCPSIGGELSIVFSSRTFITPGHNLTPFPNVTTCIVEGGACDLALSGFAEDFANPTTQTDFGVASAITRAARFAGAANQ